MESPQNSPYEYQVGGSLPPNAPSYVRRKADDELYDELKVGEFCYVLNSRQMGKSSLRVRTMQRLRAEGFACASIDVTAIGKEGVTVERWYAGIIYELESSFNLSEKFNLGKWWRERELLPPVQRLKEFIDKILLVELPQKIVIFVDESDSMVSLNFSLDDFFAFIRYCYNNRANNPEYKRLNFALFGVATPSDLIQDKDRTPFNIGRAVELNGFTFDEAQPLSQGLEEKTANSQELLQAILYWTGGQPFLTQKLCNLARKSSIEVPVGAEAEWVEQLVRSHIISNWESQDNPEHLRTIRNRILKRTQRTRRILGIYQQILQQGEVAADDSPEKMELGLSGLVIKQNSKLRVYNPIYNDVFDLEWVNHRLASLRPYAEAITAWVASNCQDESRLLRGQALEEARVWGRSQKDSDRDYQFISASENLARRETEANLEAHKKAYQILFEAKTKANKRIFRANIIIAVAVLIGVIAVGLAGKANQDLARVKAEQKSVQKEKNDAERLFQDTNQLKQEALAIQKENQKQLIELNKTRRYLGDVYLSLGDKKKAEQLYQEVVRSEQLTYTKQKQDIIRYYCCNVKMPPSN